MESRSFYKYKISIPTRSGMGILETRLKTFSEKIKTKLFKNLSGITNDKSLHNMPMANLIFQFGQLYAS